MSSRLTEQRLRAHTCIWETLCQTRTFWPVPWETEAFSISLCFNAQQTLWYAFMFSDTIIHFLLSSYYDAFMLRCSSKCHNSIIQWNHRLLSGGVCCSNHLVCIHPSLSYHLPPSNQQPMNWTKSLLYRFFFYNPFYSDVHHNTEKKICCCICYITASTNIFLTSS